MRKSKTSGILLLFFVALWGHGAAYAETIAILDATIIDLNHFGHSDKDLSNAVVLIRDGKFIAVGSASDSRSEGCASC